VVPRAIAPSSRPSQLRYFLDGGQRTLRGWYVDNFPVLGAVIGAAIVRRDDERVVQLLPSFAKFKLIWIAPKRTDSVALNDLIRILEARGETVIDPLARYRDERYAQESRDFSGIVFSAFKQVGDERRQLEEELLMRWTEQIGHGDGLLLADGSLGKPVPGVVGLVKSFTRQYVGPNEARTLFRLAEGHRMAAFQAEDTWRSDTPVRAWYQRQWRADGRDPRHALIRLELFAEWHDHPSFDDLAAWIYRERVPTAKADARWPSLLYPVHQLELMLKTQMDSLTRGWSAAVHTSG
jgi:hypothetical protein